MSERGDTTPMGSPVSDERTGITRKRMLGLVAGIAGTGILAACGGEAAPAAKAEPTKAPAGAAPTTAPAASAATKAERKMPLMEEIRLGREWEWRPVGPPAA